jgi:hypothetical protein
LTLTDVPGFTAGPHENTAADRQNVAQLARCAGAVDPSRRIVDVHSDDFSRGSGLQVQTVGSSVDVLPSASLAQQDFMKFTAASARQCVGTYVARALAQSASSSSIRFGTASILTLALPPGTDRNSFGYRFVIPLSATGVKIKVYTDLLFHRAGPAEVAFDDVGIGTPSRLATSNACLRSWLLARTRTPNKPRRLHGRRNPMLFVLSDRRHVAERRRRRGRYRWLTPPSAP